ncbi:ComEC/Rec2 family competence protein [Hyunsoonleella aestuarii]|nr:ComEC/Rec2 family competence protein [Hyunsoonleella aestuarii]
MRLLNFTIIKLTVCLIIGIAIGYSFQIPLQTNIYLVVSLFSIFLISFLVSRKQFIKTIWFGIIAYTMMICLGMLVVNFHNQKNFYNHYSEHKSFKNNSTSQVTFRIREVLKPGNYYDKYIIDILKINDSIVTGKSLLNIEKDSLYAKLIVDEIFISYLDLKDLIHPLNPHQFDYKIYLDKQYIYHQSFIKNQELFKVKTSTKTLFGIANTIRQYINSKMESHSFKPDELAIINALLLGQRQDISKEIYESYTNAGAIHILAVSGLHVGIILLILSIVLKPIEYFKYGRPLKIVLLVIFLWAFALIAGLSASVTRAVTMFSIVAIAMNLKRPTNIYNTLAISMFVILLFKPLFLFDVGFQLSYLAVFTIVSIDPILYNLWKTKYWILDKLWHTLTITVSAQFGIIPISLYYFHQFPSLFFVSNIIIIPFLGLILGIGLLVILLTSINLLPNFLANFYGGIISKMNGIVGWVSSQESFLIKDIPFNILYVLTGYVLIIALVRLYKKQDYFSLKFFLISVLLVQAAMLYTKLNKPSNQLIIFHKSRSSLIGHITKNEMSVASNSDSLSASASTTKIIKSFTVKSHIKTIKKDTLKPFYILNNKKLLVIDSLGIYNTKLFKPDYVLLRKSPKINLNRLIDSLNLEQIIADGSNYKSYIERWKKICNKRKLPFHQTGEKGAYIIDY